MATVAAYSSLSEAEMLMETCEEEKQIKGKSSTVVKNKEESVAK